MSTKSNVQKIDAICQEALRRAIPSEEEKRETIHFSKMLTRRVSKALHESGIEAEVQVQGSIAKDTWLAGEKDIDMFMLLPKTSTRDDFPTVLNAVKKVAGENWLEAYAEHPYIEAKIDGYTIDFVPSFKIEKAEDAKSSVDRTPLHTQYVQVHLDEKIKNEVRLLKRFMHGIETYGAEIKVGGFSGYLSEVLTLYYGSFYETLTAASTWRRKEVIDIKRYYEGTEDEARKIFQDNLIVIDPVDRGRNIASAVRETKLNEFIAAARGFLESPDLKFFYPDDLESLSIKEFPKAISQRGSTLVFLRFGTGKCVPDILWGQLYKSLKALRNLIERNDFAVIRDGVWSDEEADHVFLFDLDSRFLPPVKRHLGPPLEKREDCEKFLGKHLKAKDRIAGPYVEGDRWIVETRRAYIDVISLLKDRLTDRGGKLGVASLVSEALTLHFEVFVNEEIAGFYESNCEFARFLTDYLDGRPRWLH